jgi:hypothetical protein
MDRNNEDTANPVDRRGILAALGVFGLGSLAISRPTEAMSSSGTDIQWCDTYAELRNLVGGNPETSTSKVVAVVRGSTTGGPYLGGGGVFVWSTTVTADNGGTVITKSSAPTGSWKRLYDGSTNVRWFGAKGNGSVNDKVAIQAAITFAQANGNTVFVPAGEYRLDSEVTVPANTKIVGEGSHEPALLKTSLFVAGSSGVARMFNITGGFVTIENLAVIGYSDTRTTDGFAVGETTSDIGRITFRNVLTRLCKSGFKTRNGAWMLLFDSCTAWDCIEGFHFDGTGSLNARGANIATLLNCHGVSCSEHNVLAQSSNAVSILGGGFDYGKYGIRQEYGDMAIEGCTLDLSSIEAVSILAGRARLSNISTYQAYTPFSFWDLPGTKVEVDIERCTTGSTTGTRSVSTSPTAILRMRRNTFDKAIENDGPRFAKDYRIESGYGLVTASGSTDLLVQDISLQRGFSTLLSVQVTPVSNYTRHISDLVSFVTPSSFRVEFQRTDGTTWLNGQQQQYYWTAVGID